MYRKARRNRGLAYLLDVVVCKKVGVLEQGNCNHAQLLPPSRVMLPGVARVINRPNHPTPNSTASLVQLVCHRYCSFIFHSYSVNAD